jgi:hypothetical protein
MDYASPEHACGFDRSELYSDERPPVGKVGAEPWAEMAFNVEAWMLRWN